MAIKVIKSKLGVEDIFFDENGTGGTAQVPTSDGVSVRNVSRVNASHIPLPLDLREVLGDNLYTALESLLEAINATIADASTTEKGLVKLATGQETADASNPTAAVTPVSLSSRTATTLRTGLIQLATEAEAIAGTNNSRAIVPAVLLSVLEAKIASLLPTASSSVKGGVKVGDGLEMDGETLKLTSIGVGYPDWENQVARSFNTSYTASVNGWFWIKISSMYNESWRQINFIINGITMDMGKTAGYYMHSTWGVAFYPIKTGDTYQVNYTNQSEDKLFFIPNV